MAEFNSLDDILICNAHRAVNQLIHDCIKKLHHCAKIRMPDLATAGEVLKELDDSWGFHIIYQKYDDTWWMETRSLRF